MRFRQRIASARVLPAAELRAGVGPTLGVEANLGGGGDVDHVVHPPVPAETAGAGRSPRRTLRSGRCPSRRRTGSGRRTGHVTDVGQRSGGHDGSDAGQVHQPHPGGDDDRLALLVRAVIFLSTAQLGQLLGRESAPGLAGQVPRPYRSQDRLALQRGDVLLGLTGGQLSEQPLQPVNASGSGSRSAPPVGRPASQRLEPVVVGQLHNRPLSGLNRGWSPDMGRCPRRGSVDHLSGDRVNCSKDGVGPTRASPPGVHEQVSHTGSPSDRPA